MQSPHPARRSTSGKANRALSRRCRAVCAGHLVKGVAALFRRREGRVPLLVGNAGILGIEVEVFSVRMAIRDL